MKADEEGTQFATFKQSCMSTEMLGQEIQGHDTETPTWPGNLKAATSVLAIKAEAYREAMAELKREMEGAHGGDHRDARRDQEGH